ncbi:EpsG family protein [Chitinophaga nivalis]|uniref:EpsG family protein n=1 Tax=Chitinophaga nivalis TaxID=2991709 RepID=A0ABT3IW68_9BACT|nr:EpsG family protein [Chitinophaga nivalis]MCW3462077.1 EpsG family protein [Chitinophaga nivalis]MCW3488231.1 EpsG family protein [Chitinophaga nivalis]
MIYLFVFIVLAIIGGIDLIKLSKEQVYLKTFLLFFAFAILVFFAGLRYNTGPDWRDYNNFFNEIFPLYDFGRTSPAVREILEPGFIALVSFFKTIVNHNQFVFLGLAFTSLTLVFLRIKEYSLFPLATVFCYYMYGYPDNFSILRQVLSISIFFWSVKYIVNKNYIKYYVCVILACCFHNSALILFPLYFILNKRWKSKYILLAFLIAILCYQFNVVSQLFTYALSSMGGMLARYSDYLTNESLSKPKLLGTLFIERTLILGLLLYKREEFERRQKYFNVFLNIFILYNVSYLVLSQVFVLLRFIQYFAFASCILYPFLLIYFKEAYGKYIVYAGIIFILFFRGYTALILDGKDGDNPNRYLPYRSVIES